MIELAAPAGALPRVWIPNSHGHGDLAQGDMALRCGDAAPTQDRMPDGVADQRWSRRRALALVVGVSFALWGMILSAALLL